jgi:hypothetical protein
MMRVGFTGSLSLPTTSIFHYHDLLFVREEGCPRKWGRSRVVSLAQTGIERLGSLWVAYGPALAAVSDKLNQTSLPSPFVVVVVAQEPDAVQAANALSWVRPDQQARLVCVGPTTVSEAFLSDGLQVIDRSGEPGSPSYGAPAGLVPMALPVKAPEAKPPAPKKKAKATTEVEPPSAPSEPETLAEE